MTAEPPKTLWTFENEAVLYVVQALVGNVPPWLQAVAIDADEAHRSFRLILAIDPDAPDPSEVVDDIVVDIEAPSGGTMDVIPVIARDADWLDGPARGHRMVFARADRT